MAATGPSSRDGVLADINVTPLVDVMLVLLVIFMVTAPLITQGVDVDLPQAEAAALPSDEDKLVLTLDARGRAYLGDVEVPIADLPDKLRHNARVQRDKELFLHADRSLPYGDVVRVMGIAKSAGVTSLGMVTDPLTTQGAAPAAPEPR